ncbi:hypothetical protein O8B93_21770 [Agrobacterium rhizogenes]|uniref:hypothetical protein n=1 Tax=Rhizobium rhizogenes TaxID=359 RepID=UPI0022B659CF|nr:hypothetical protein [Rhizobium rhizogenes]MCZ7450218.1 hypothetical protein [Rhizobium rhizogenes]
MASILHQVIEKSPELIVGVLSTIVAGLLAVLVKSGTYKPVICRFKAKRLKARKGEGICVLVCEFEGDTRGRLSKIVRSNITTNYAADPTANIAPINVVSFPLSLAAVGDDEEGDDRNKAVARRWLNEASCDVIIWGERLDETNHSIIKIMGKSTEAAHLRELKLQVGAGEINNVIAEAVTREVLDEQTNAFTSPEPLSLDYLRLIAKKSSLLLSSDLAGFTNETAKAIRVSLNRLLTEICLRSSRISDWDDALANAEKLSALYCEKQELRQFGEAASIFASHFRRRAWAGIDLLEIRNGLATIERAAQSLQGRPEHRDLLDHIAVEIEFIKATHNRDANEADCEVDALSVFRIFKSTTKARTKRLCIAFLASFDPLDLLKSEGISQIQVGFLRRSWGLLECAQLPPDLRSSVFESLVEEQVSIASTSINVSLYEDVMVWILEMEPACTEIARLFWAIAFADTASLILKRFGISFFDERFPKLNVAGRLTAVSGELFAGASSYAQAPYLQLYFLGRAGSASSGLGSLTGDDMHFSMADSAYATQELILKQRFPKRLQQALFERCSSLNTWSLRASDRAKADLSISLLESVDAAAERFGCYLLGFAHMARAYITMHNAADNPTILQRQSALAEARVALSFCKKAFSLPNKNGKQGTEAIDRVMSNATEFIARWDRTSAKL